MKRQYFIIISLISIVFTGCAVGGKYKKATVEMPTKYNFQGAAAVSDTITQIKWWDLYQDPCLQKLITQALDSNLDLLNAASKIEEARLVAGVAKADLFPHFGYNISAGTGNVKPNAQQVGAGLNGDAFKGAGTLSWELDIWGKLRSSNWAAVNTMLAQVEYRNAFVVSLISEVADLYFLLRDYDNRLMIARSTLESRREHTKIITQRFEQGYVSEIDKLQAEQQDMQAYSSALSSEREIIILENTIRSLLGLPPGKIERGMSNEEQRLNPEIPVGLPSQLLLRRPDIRSVEKKMEAQFNRIGVAKASMFPSISLTGMLGMASPELKQITEGDAFFAVGNASLIGPLFEFGKNKKRVGIEKQRLEQVTYSYHQTILNALGEVENSLSDYRIYSKSYEVRQKQVISAKKALDLVVAKYDKGYSSYLDVINAQTTLFDAQLQESATLRNKLSSTVNLYKALGGGW